MTSGISAAAALFALNVALAQAPAWGVAELMSELHGVSAVRAKFVETKYFSTLSTPLELSGTLAYRAPDHLEKRTLRPLAERLVLDGDTLVVDDGRRQKTYALERNAPLRAFVESIRATLAGDLDALKRYYDVTLTGAPGAWRLVLRPTEPSMQSLVSEIRIGGRQASVERIELFTPAGDRSLMTIFPETP
jgi:outer membrane lipoprotein-sorting protein